MSRKAIDEAIQRRIPEKTQKTKEWVFSVFRSWCDGRGIDEDIDWGVLLWDYLL